MLGFILRLAAEEYERRMIAHKKSGTGGFVLNGYRIERPALRHCQMTMLFRAAVCRFVPGGTSQLQTLACAAQSNVDASSFDWPLGAAPPGNRGTAMCSRAAPSEAVA